MYPPITCTCGASIGDKYQAYELIRTKAYAEHFKKTGVKVNPNSIPYSQDIDISMRHAFTQLKIKLPCCKARIMTAVRFESVY